MLLNGKLFSNTVGITLINIRSQCQFQGLNNLSKLITKMSMEQIKSYKQHAHTSARFDLFHQYQH